MLDLNENHYQIINKAIDLILERKRNCVVAGKEMYPSAIVNARDLVLRSRGGSEFKNNLMAHEFTQISKAIAIANARLFFISHTANEENCVEKLATFIEDNSFDVTL